MTNVDPAIRLMCFLQSTALQPSTDKALEVALSFSQSLSQWAYIVIGGSIAVLFRDLKYRPQDKWIRRSFWLFIPGWVLLTFSIYQGIRVQQRFVARWMNPIPQLNEFISKFNFHTRLQIWSMKLGLGVFAVWLVVFLIRWIVYKECYIGADRDDA